MSMRYLYLFTFFLILFNFSYNFMHTDTKLPNNILANPIEQYLKRIIHHQQVVFNSVWKAGSTLRNQVA